jgi:hypothetical protein
MTYSDERAGGLRVREAQVKRVSLEEVRDLEIEPAVSFVPSFAWAKAGKGMAARFRITATDNSDY